MGMSRLIQVTALVALVAAPPLTVACNSAPDVKDRVDRSLEQARIQHVNVDYDQQAKVVHLKGTVASSADRQRAEQVAATAVGTTGTVLNELTVEGLNEDTADNRDGEIRDRLNEIVDNNPVLKDRDVNFDVNNGVVTVKGTVRTAAEKTQVGDLVKAAPGVKDFANELQVEPKGR
jgi:osmotically-inducible protein OsmY